MPRAELQALCNAAQCATFVRRELGLPPSLPIQLWTDSRCCVDWLVSRKLINRFEDNRLRIIKEFPVNHIEGKQNPADCASRGLNDPRELKHFWFHGPRWLAGPSADFPTPTAAFIPADNEYEQWETSPAQSSPVEFEPHLDFSRFSKWTYIQNTIAYIWRGTRRMKWSLEKPRRIRLRTGNDPPVVRTIDRKITSFEGFRHMMNPALSSGDYDDDPLQPPELRLAERTLFQLVQKEFPPSDGIKQRLGIYYNEERKLLVCRGRFGLGKRRNLLLPLLFFILLESTGACITQTLPRFWV
jgi:hypothetical protein